MHSRPVFADPSGRRRRLLRRAGLAAAAALAVCLCMVLVAMAGGPQAPFTHWAAPGHTSLARGSPAATRHGKNTGSPSPSAGPRSTTPSPASAAAPRPSASASPVRTNPVGKTPGSTRSPNPHKSSHGP